jgi:cyclase
MCFTLLYADGKFHLSRNFKLQTVGDVDWLMSNYEFESITRSIDELLILNVGNEGLDSRCFLESIEKVVKYCFMPVAVGGGVRNIEQAQLLFQSGADKVVLNSAFFTNTQLITNLVRLYGRQSIVASIDFRRNTACEAEVFIDGGRENTKILLADAVSLAAFAGAGEIYLNSIDRDGTGMGYDLSALETAFKSCDLPIIAAGGADTSDRLIEGVRSGFVSAVSTAHLFNFMCDGLRDARQEMILDGIPLSRWNFEDLKLC